MPSVEAQRIESARRIYAAAIGTGGEEQARAAYVAELERIKQEAAQQRRKVATK